LTNFLYNNATVIVAIVLGFVGFIRYVREQHDAVQKRAEERFEQIVKSLGSQYEQERISAAVLLSTFLSPGYKRFYTQVFNLAAGHLRMNSFKQDKTYSNNWDATTSVLQGPLTQTLATVLLESYTLAREALFDRHKDDAVLGRHRDEADIYARRQELVGQSLNAAGVQLDLSYLRGADLNYAWLRQASLQKATLSGAQLFSANLENTNMEGADLTSVDLRWAILIKANFTGANLEGALLSYTRADNAIFKDACLVNITINEGTAIGADFTAADLTNATFIGVKFAPPEETPLLEANPEAAKKLTGARFKNVTGLTKSQIDSCREKGANFEDCIAREQKK
jgi:uncharacterized protein YjbI with pentapeptide repeats